MQALQEEKLSRKELKSRVFEEKEEEEIAVSDLDDSDLVTLSFTHSLTQSLSQSPILSLTEERVFEEEEGEIYNSGSDDSDLVSHSSSHSPAHSFTHSFTHSITYSPTQTLNIHVF